MFAVALNEMHCHLDTFATVKLGKKQISKQDQRQSWKFIRKRCS